jgi:hypothetical protein
MSDGMNPFKWRCPLCFDQMRLYDLYLHLHNHHKIALPELFRMGRLNQVRCCCGAVIRSDKLAAHLGELRGEAADDHAALLLLGFEFRED